jgi:hypothetical protein
MVDSFDEAGELIRESDDILLLPLGQPRMYEFVYDGVEEVVAPCIGVNVYPLMSIIDLPK